MDILKIPLTILYRTRCEWVAKDATQHILKLMRLGLIVVSVLTFWNVIRVVVGVEMPIFVVAQYDMRPVLNVGDLAIM